MHTIRSTIPQHEWERSEDDRQLVMALMTEKLLKGLPPGTETLIKIDEPFLCLECPDRLVAHYHWAMSVN